MNTQGWIRGYISFNSPVDKFVDFVLCTIGNEFGVPTSYSQELDDFKLNIGEFSIKLSGEKVKELQKQGPYSLDKMILDTMHEHGFEFDKSRSQYIRYCYGSY